MARSKTRWAGALVAAAVAVGAYSCRVEIPEDALFTCAIEEDCGGDGWLCAPRAGTSGVCCLPSAEQCNGKDDDCNGQVDDGLEPAPCYEGPAGTAGVGLCTNGAKSCRAGAVGEACEGQVLPAAELCNGLDDDCDGLVDEDFNLQTDRAHCGSCNNPCAENQQCRTGICQVMAETSCTDGIDNDENGLTDCEDPQCEWRSCGEGCICTADQTRKEIACGDGLDNDGDLLFDCADPDCFDQSCGQGCACANEEKKETDCGDGLDNDGDEKTDCADPDCAGKSCGPGCSCADEVKTETACADGLDNDGDELVDCDDPDCATLPCGPSCTCGGTEICTDKVDNSGNGLADCADPSCAAKACGPSCVCGGTENCTDGLDNDGNLLIDCADPQCAGLPCGSETSCTDMVDNNGDGLTDCQDTVACPPETPCSYLNPGGAVKAGFCRSNKTCA